MMSNDIACAGMGCVSGVRGFEVKSINAWVWVYGVAYGLYLLILGVLWPAVNKLSAVAFATIFVKECFGLVREGRARIYCGISSATPNTVLTCCNCPSALVIFLTSHFVNSFVAPSIIEKPNGKRKHNLPFLWSSDDESYRGLFSPTTIKNALLLSYKEWMQVDGSSIFGSRKQTSSNVMNCPTVLVIMASKLFSKFRLFHNLPFYYKFNTLLERVQEVCEMLQDGALFEFALRAHAFIKIPHHASPVGSAVRNSESWEWDCTVSPCNDEERKGGVLLWQLT